MFNRCVFLLGREDRWSEMQLSPSTIPFLFVYLFAFLLFFLVLFCCWGLWGLWITGLWCLCWDWLVCCGLCLLMAALSSACSPSLCCCDVVVLTGALTTQLFFSLSLKHTHTTHNPLLDIKMDPTTKWTTSFVFVFPEGSAHLLTGCLSDALRPTASLLPPSQFLMFVWWHVPRWSPSHVYTQYALC